MKTRSQIEQEFLQAFSDNMSNPVNMDKLGVGFKTFSESNKIVSEDGSALYDPTKPYGVVWNDIEDTYFRVGHTIPIIQQQFRRCVTIGNPQFGGSVYKYLDADDSTKFEDGSSAVDYVTRADGAYNVMVEVPKYYKKNYKEGANNYKWQGIKPFDGATTEIAFKMNGWTDSGDGTDEAHEADYTYISAFEGVLYDDSQGFCVNGDGTNRTADATNDKIVSTAGYKPWSYETIVNSRTLIANGNGKQFDWNRYTVLRQCFLIEFMTHDSQDVIPGYTENTSGATYANDVLKTGITLSLGNNSGSISGSDIHSANGGDGGFNGVVANSYRGIENFYGHLWQWVDAINITERRPHICGIDDTFESDRFSAPYVNQDMTQPSSNGYQSKITSNFLVEAIGANSGSKITDYYWQSSGNRVVRSGGNLYYSARAGVACLHCNYSSGDRYWIFCCRL